jgi:hypothetical protein
MAYTIEPFEDVAFLLKVPPGFNDTNHLVHMFQGYYIKKNEMIEGIVFPLFVQREVERYLGLPPKVIMPMPDLYDEEMQYLAKEAVIRFEKQQEETDRMMKARVTAEEAAVHKKASSSPNPVIAAQAAAREQKLQEFARLWAEEQTEDMLTLYLNKGSKEPLTEDSNRYKLITGFMCDYMREKYKLFECNPLHNQVYLVDPALEISENYFLNMATRLLYKSYVDCARKPMYDAKGIEMISHQIIKGLTICEVNDKYPDKLASHVNLLIFNLIDSTVYRFEPNGRWSTKYAWVNDSLTRIVEGINEKLRKHRIHLRPLTYADINDVDAVQHIQHTCPAPMSEYEKKGLCMYWGFFMLEVLLRNPYKPFAEVLHETNEFVSNENVRNQAINVIRGYVNYTNEVLEKFKEILPPRRLRNDLEDLYKFYGSPTQTQFFFRFHSAFHNKRKVSPPHKQTSPESPDVMVVPFFDAPPNKKKSRSPSPDVVFQGAVDKRKRTRKRTPSPDVVILGSVDKRKRTRKRTPSFSEV